MPFAWFVLPAWPSGRNSAQRPLASCIKSSKTSREVVDLLVTTLIPSASSAGDAQGQNPKPITTSSSHFRTGAECRFFPGTTADRADLVCREVILDLVAKTKAPATPTDPTYLQRLSQLPLFVRRDRHGPRPVLHLLRLGASAPCSPCPCAPSSGACDDQLFESGNVAHAARVSIYSIGIEYLNNLTSSKL